MKRHLIIIAIAFIGLTLNSCVFNFKSETVKGDGNVVTREYTINDFDEFVCALPATVNFSVADNYTCTIRVDENLFDYIDIKSKDGELELGQPKPKGGKYANFDATEFVIDITGPRIDEITLAGSGDINILSPLNEQNLEISIAGSGNVVFKAKIRLMIFFAAKDGEALYTQQKQDQELTVAQIMNSLLQIQTEIEKSGENH